ncbi:MAG: LamG-like jellyroll fold domain-containing protein [Kiritimatiellia bacterium]|jgi:hypothetical protein
MKTKTKKTKTKKTNVCIRPMIGAWILCMGLTLNADAQTVVAHWKFDEDAPLVDSAGNYNLTDASGGKIIFTNGVAKFNEPLATPANTLRSGNIDFNAHDALTVEVWVRLGDHDNFDRLILCSYGWQSSTAGWFGIGAGYFKEKPGSVRAGWHRSGNEANETTGYSYPLAADGWHHIAFVMQKRKDGAPDGKDHSALYVDGVFQGERTMNSTTAVFRDSQRVTIGMCDEFNGVGALDLFGKRSFIGDIADIKITGAALSPDQFLSAPSVSDSAPAGAVTWTGLGTTDNWSDAANWSGGSLPAAGDAVHVGTANRVVLDLETATPRLGSLTVAGTLAFANWTGRVDADEVSVGSFGWVTTTGAFDNTTSNRVWFSCSNLTVAAGGVIDVVGRGYKSADSKITMTSACGPGAAEAAAHGGSHGSFGTTRVTSKAAYGDAEWPEAPGSGGYMWNKDLMPGDAGGAVRIDATGTVTVNGRIDASAANMIEYVKYGRATGASGGSVLISCKRIAGTGVLAARGANGTGHVDSCAGAGGRMAIHYDPTVQTADDAAQLVFDVRGGRHSENANHAKGETSTSLPGGAGTLWLPDAKLITPTTLDSLRGRLVNAPTLTLDGDVTLTQWVGFANDGATITINGNLTLDGADSRLEMGSVSQILEYRCTRRSYTSATPGVLTVTGDLTVKDAARLDVFAARTNGTDAAGAFVNVGGTLTVATNSLVYPFAEPVNGGAPVFTANNVRLDAGSVVGAPSSGFAGRNGGAGWGPGAGNNGIGAGHGGAGGHATAQNGLANDDPLRPGLPGSGACFTWGPSLTSLMTGGGHVHIIASNDMQVAGMIAVNGDRGLDENTAMHSSGSGAGGTIFLEAKTVTLASTASLVANGAEAPKCPLTFSGGGGGCIAIWSGLDLWNPDMPQGFWSERSLDELPSSFQIDPAATFSVAGGPVSSASSSAAGEDGTIRFVHVHGPLATILIVK